MLGLLDVIDEIKLFFSSLARCPSKVVSLYITECCNLEGNSYEAIF
jgi:hypothetical protein